MGKPSSVLELAPTGRLANLEDPEQVWELVGDELTLGARRDNDLVLRDVGVSRVHARLVREDEQWVIQDAGSRHGILINEARVARHTLASGDHVMIGVATLRYDAVDLLPLSSSSVRWPEALEFIPPARRPLVLVAATVGLLLMLMSAVGGAADGATAAGPATHEGQSAHVSLVAGDYRLAEKGFRRAAARAARGPSRKQARTLEQVAQVWMSKEKGPQVFRWDRAFELLERARGLSDLPAPTRRWLDEQATWVESGRVAYAAVRGAKAAALKAQNQLASGDVEGAVATLEAGLAAIASIPQEGPLADELTLQVSTLRGRIYAALVQLAGVQGTGEQPNYEASLAFLERAREYAADAKSRSAVRQLADAARMNRDDEQHYVTAVQQLTSRQLDRYDEALALLNRVDPRSRVYPEAQAWASWAVADTKTRRAEGLYAQGHAQDALRLLDEAEAVGVDAHALQAIRERRDRWTRVGTAYLRGRDMSRAGHAERAMDALESVLALEPDRSNRYRQQAKEILEHMVRSDRTSQQLTLRRGLLALERGDYSAAHRAFEAIRLDPGRRNEDGAAIAKAVRDANRGRGLLASSRRTLHVDAVEEFEELRDLLTLLRRWLHRTDPDREEAIKFLEVVDRRLRNHATGAERRS